MTEEIKSEVLELMKDKAPLLYEYDAVGDFERGDTAEGLIDELEREVYDADITWGDDEEALDFIKKNDPGLDHTMHFIRECNREGHNMCRIEDLSTALLANYCWQMLAIKEIDSIKESIIEIYE